MAKKTVDPMEKNLIHIKGKKKVLTKKKLDPITLKTGKKVWFYKGEKKSKKTSKKSSFDLLRKWRKNGS